MFANLLLNKLHFEINIYIKVYVYNVTCLLIMIMQIKKRMLLFGLGVPVAVIVRPGLVARRQILFRYVTVIHKFFLKVFSRPFSGYCSVLP